MNLFEDKVAVVTGGASGIGQAVCEALGRRGAVVTVADIDVAGARAVASAIAEAGGRACAVHLDVTQAEAVQKLVDDTVAEQGRLDYMFNNAGIAIGGEERDLNLDHWRRIIDVNLWGVIYGTKAAYPVMIEQGFGHIVNTASVAGLLPVPGETPYATTKHAVVGLSTSLRLEGEAFGVKVSAVCPGFVQTGIFEAATLVNADMNELMDKLPFKVMPVQQAAAKTLRGVERNKAIIVFPFYARLAWWLYRWIPRATLPLARRMIRDLRSIRKEP